MNKAYPFLYSLLLLLASSSVQAQSLAAAKEAVQAAEEAIFEARGMEAALQKNAQALKLFQQEGLEGWTRYAQLNALAAQLQQQEFPAAWKELQKLKALPPVELSQAKGLFLTNEAWALWGLTQYEQALVLADSAAQYWKEQGNASQYGYALLLGAYAIYYDKKSNFGDLDRHLKLLEQVLKKGVPPSSLVSRHYYQLQSGVQRQQGHIELAIEYNLRGLKYEQQALQQSQEASDSNRVAKTYSQLGRLYGENGALEQSIGYYKKALDWYKQLNNYGELLKLSTRLGQLYHQLGNYAQAKYYFASLKLYWMKIPSSPIWQKNNNTFQHLAKAYYYQYFGYHDSLLTYYNNQLPYLKKHQLAVSKAYQNIGQSAAALGRFDQANQAYQAALDYTTKTYGQKGSKPAQLYWILGKLATQQQDNSTAISYFDQAIQALFLGKPTAQQALLSPEEFSDKALAAKVYKARGELYFKQATYAQAQQDFDQMVVLAHFLRDNYTGVQSKLSSAQQLRPIYEKAAFCVWQQQQGSPSPATIEAIFQYAESSKASLLYEHLTKFRNNYAHAGIGVPDSLLQKEEQLLIQIARYQEQERTAKYSQNKERAAFYGDKTFALQQELQLLERALVRAFPHYKTWEHGRSQTASLTKVQASLLPSQVIIEYFLAESYCFIIYITKEEAVLTAVPKHKKGRFEKKVRQLHHLLSHFEQAKQDSMTYYKLAEEAHWLYEHYLEHPILEGKKELLLLPDQDLHYIPFEVLLFETPQLLPNAYEALPYLLKKFALQYHYSAALFLRTQNQVNTQSGKVLGFAATYGNQHEYHKLSPALQKERSQEEVQIHNYSPPIPGTMDELEYLQQHFRGDFFTGELASERQFKHYFSEQDYGVVHLAMHGTINYQQPAYSSLVFTENLDSLEDNLLYVYETQHLNGQQANLVVLSACKTGYGRYAEGEGIISLGRSFMQAGVPSVIMTLWELNDVTSIRIMAGFYDLLAQGKAKDEALRQAKLQYLKENQGLTAHPFFWASPILIGNAVEIPTEKRQQPWMIWVLVGGLVVGIVISWRVFGQ